MWGRGGGSHLLGHHGAISAGDVNDAAPAGTGAGNRRHRSHSRPSCTTADLKERLWLDDLGGLLSLHHRLWLVGGDLEGQWLAANLDAFENVLHSASLGDWFGHGSNTRTE